MRKIHFLSLILIVAVLAGCDSAAVDPAPDSPEPVLPDNGSTDVSTAVELGWTASREAENYRVQVGLDPSFSSTPLHDLVVEANSVPINSLAQMTTYFWRVRAEGLTGESEWSNTWSFMPTVEAQIPATPALTYPDHLATRLSPEVIFRWEHAEQATSYDFQVSVDESFYRNEVDVTSVRTDHYLVTGLEKTYTYFWRVRACNPLGESAWSPIREILISFD